MHRGVKQRCVRCIVQLSLQKVSWQDSNNREVHLNGPLVFLRACILGQLQHSHLHQPLFPIELNQQLQFDRVFTNCKNPLLFNEMIQGEHVRIEIIQVSKDCTGGRVLARYEASANTFLFPDEPGPLDGDTRHVQLTRHSKAVQNKTPPVLSFTTSTILLEATVHSPVSPLFVGQDTCVGEDVEFCSAHTSPVGKNMLLSPSELGPAGSSGESVRGCLSKDSAMSRLSGSHSESNSVHATPSSCKPTKVKFEPRKVRQHTDGSGPGHEDHPQADNSAHSDTDKQLYRTVTSDIGLHPWEMCPRRKPEKLTARSAPAVNLSSESNKRTNRVLLLPNLAPSEGHCLEHTDPTLYPCSPTRTIPNLRPPFVVRHADPSVLSRRDFCGACSAPSIMKHFKSKREAAAGDEDQAFDTVSPSVTVEKESAEFRAMQSGPSLSELYEKYLGGTSTGEVSTSERASLQLTTLGSSAGSNRQFVGHDGKASTLVAEPGNVRSGVPSPAKQIEEKVQRLRKECCGHTQHSAETVAEDSLNEDLNRLRASLAAERSEVFGKAYIPDTSLTVKVGPEDYWSQRMAEYTGHPHRLLFDETLEKIYHRLYQNASVIK